MYPNATIASVLVARTRLVLTDGVSPGTDPPRGALPVTTGCEDVSPFPEAETPQYPAFQQDGAGNEE